MGVPPSVFGRSFSPKQTTYYLYEGVCEGTSVVCDSDSSCSGGRKCILTRTNQVCDPDENFVNCYFYGYDEKPGIIDRYTNNIIHFNVYQTGNNIGEYCDNTDSNCGSPWTVIGWFKKNSTKGCSDNENGIIEASDYMNLYNGSVGICDEYNCTNFIEPTEKSCISGELYGYTCEDSFQCGEGGICISDKMNGGKYCYKEGEDKKLSSIGMDCIFDEDCGFSGVCSGNNVYSYINDASINTSSCTTVSRESGCILFNNTADKNLKYASKATYEKVRKNGNGKGVSPVVGDDSKGMNQRDSNVIIKVDRDRECAEWLSFPDGVNYKTIVTDFDVDNSDSIKTCTELNNSKNCESNSFGTGYNNVLDVSYYISQMTGEWANKDFSGFAIPNIGSIDKKKKEMEGGVPDDSSYIWQNTSTVAGSTSIFTGNEKYASNKICKSYPEKDSPYNFSDKYKVDLYKCDCGSSSVVGDTCNNIFGNVSYSLVDVNRDGSLWSGVNAWCVKDESNNYTKVLSQNNKVLAFTYEQFKNFVPRDYFQQVKSGITLPYEKSSIASNEFLIWVDDEQECYYQKLQYVNYNTPSEQYFGGNGVAPQEVCYTAAGTDGSTSGKVNISGCKDNDREKFIGREKTTFNNIESDSKEGYCIEYDYSKEIYYSGSGKYNCITWIPGYVE